MVSHTKKIKEMNRKQEGKYIMGLGLSDLVNNNEETIDKIPNFKKYYAKYLENLACIGNNKGKQRVNRSGVKDSKKELRNKLSKSSIDTSNKLAAYAMVTNNKILSKEIHVTESELLNASDSKLLDMALILHAKATEHKQGAETYDITPEYLTNLYSLIEQFRQAIPSTRARVTESKAVTDQLSQLSKENDVLLENMDTLVEVIKFSHPEFYSKYKDTRKVINLTAGMIALTINITGDDNGEAIKGATATILPASKENVNMADLTSKPLVKRIAKNGTIRIKHLPKGTYIIIIEKPGYETVTQTVTISSGDKVVVEIKLTKSQLAKPAL